MVSNNHYPFGLKHKGYNNAPLTNHLYKYNGVELNESLDLDLYEMDVRQYDPAIARFTSIDPVTHHSMSTYNAFDNNPVLIADPSGADGDEFNSLRGSRIGFASSTASVYETTFTASNGNTATVVHDGNKVGSATTEINGVSGSLSFEGKQRPEFINSINSYIKKIASTLIGYATAFSIINSGKHFRIKEVDHIRQQGTTTEVSSDGKKITGGISSVSLQEGFIDGVFTNGFFNLSHEFFHLYRRTLGENYFKALHRTKDPGGVNYSEAQAVGFENYLRGSLSFSSKFTSPRLSYTPQGRQFSSKIQLFTKNRGFFSSDNWTLKDFTQDRLHIWKNLHKTAKERINER